MRCPSCGGSRCSCTGSCERGEGMLIRNACVEGYGLVDLRLMHGAVQEIGVGLIKGLYEAELDLQGDMLTACPPGMELPRKYRRRGGAGESAHIAPGSREPFLRWRDGEMLGFIDSHAAD